MQQKVVPVSERTFTKVISTKIASLMSGTTNSNPIETAVGQKKVSVPTAKCSVIAKGTACTSTTTMGICWFVITKGLWIRKSFLPLST